MHRDLKPENVVVTKEGHAKVLDFGLARFARSCQTGDDDPTAVPLTAAGVVMGTVAYMSPEQAQGRELDHRSDQFSLGVMLYEMATGRRPFEQRTAAETIAAILRDPPPALDASVLPPPLQWLIERCLAKDPGDRYASTRELASELRASSTSSRRRAAPGWRPASARLRRHARRSSGARSSEPRFASSS